VKRLGINLGTLSNYDSGQITQNLVMQNPGFEGQIWNSTIRCASGTAYSCTDENQYSGWTADFWDGATFEVFYGAAAGRTGTVSISSAPGNGTGITLSFSSAGTALAAGDYLIVRKTVPGGSTGGWYPTTFGAGTISDNLWDLPPGTLGKQTAALNAPGASDGASISGYFDSLANKTFVQLNGTYQLQFKAKGTGGSNQINIRLARSGGTLYLNQPQTLTSTWNTYTAHFTANENGSAIGTVGVSFSTVGADSFELDDVSLTQTSGDPTNVTAFRDPVVNALRTLQPGVLRFWGGQLGETLDNLITPDFGRQRAGYLTWSTSINVIDYGLHDFLVLCQAVGAEPWFVVPSTFSTTDATHLIDYLAGDSSTVYGAKRVALGQTTPWAQVFPKIHLEFGNEAWNSTFEGGTIMYPAPYAARAQTIFGVMRGTASYTASSFDLVLGGQAVNPWLNAQIQNGCNNNDSFDIAPYTMNQVDSYTDNESLYGPTFAEPEAFMSSTGTAEGVSPGMVYQDYKAIQGSSHPVPLSFYEINLSTMYGAITQQALNSYTPSLGAGLMVVDTMLQGLRQFGIVNQELFALPQYDFIRPDGKSVLLWGSVVDMGVTDRRRPQFLALQLANQALSNGAAMLQTVHTGADPTWNQALVNTVQLSGAHYLQSFAFSQGSNRSAVVFNLSRSAYLPVTFSGANAPSGTVQMQQLTSANPTDTNESANVVSIMPSTLSNFNASAGLTLPPYSMTVLTWSTGSGQAAPVISGVNVSSITSTSATVSWTTDQPSSSQVEYGTTSVYASSSALNYNLVTSHKVTLTGLTGGTSYNFDVVSANSASTSSTSATSSFSTIATAVLLPVTSTPTPVTPAAAAPPVISAVAAAGITTTSAVITWTTDQATTSQVQYGTSGSYGLAAAPGTSLVTAHSMTLTGLYPGTTYDFEVISANSAGTSSQSANYTFITQAASGNAPTVSYLASWGVTGSGITISWSTDLAASTAVGYGTTPALGSMAIGDATLTNSHGMTLTGLNPGTTYYFAAESTGANGMTGYSAINSFTTTNTVAPTISGITVTPGNNNKAQISWSTSVPCFSYVQYGTSTAYGWWTSRSALTTNPQESMTWVPSGVIHYQLVSTDALGNQVISPDYTFVEP
jgi:alpha-L-arabinofuranosidase